MAIDETGGRVDEDFSLMPGLFPPRLRPHVRAFGRFVRLVDGILDSPGLSRAEKLARLEILEAALAGRACVGWSESADAVVGGLRASLAETDVSPVHAQTLLAISREDAAGLHIRTWDELVDFCAGVAAPIGRYLLELTGEDAAACGPAADALSASVRILKRLRDSRDSTGQLSRLCIPQGFLEDAKVTLFHLSAPAAKGQTRAVLDRVLDGVDRLLDQAAPLPRLLRSRGLALHAAIVYCRARKLAHRFRHDNPLTGRVGLTGGQRLGCHWRATIQRLLPGW
jgi:phytoene/squalene synthetase